MNDVSFALFGANIHRRTNDDNEKRPTTTLCYTRLVNSCKSLVRGLYNVCIRFVSSCLCVVRTVVRNCLQMCCKKSVVGSCKCVVVCSCFAVNVSATVFILQILSIIRDRANCMMTKNSIVPIVSQIILLTISSHCVYINYLSRPKATTTTTKATVTNGCCPEHCPLL